MFKAYSCQHLNQFQPVVMAVLTFEQCKERILRPVNASAINEGMQNEQKHKLHIRGDRRLMELFLEQNNEVETKETYNLRLRSTRAITKTVYAPILNYITKCLDMGGLTAHYHFRNDEDEIFSSDFEQYLNRRDWDGMDFYESIHSKLKAVHFTDFQGVLYVDAPTMMDENSPYLMPYFDMFSSSHIHDIDIIGHKVEFIILKQDVVIKKEGAKEDEWTRYYCIDDAEIRVMRKDKKGDPVFDTSFVSTTEQGTIPRWEIPNVLNYVPAFVLSHQTVEATSDIARTSIIGQSMEIADLMLNDHSEHELNKRLHAFQEKWVHARECTNCHGEKTYIYDDDIGPQTCRTCHGEGSLYPTGPSKVFLLKPPDHKDDYDPGVPAGYIDKDLSPTEYLDKQMDKWKQAISVSVFSQDLQANISPETATAKEIDDDDKQTVVRQFIKFVEVTVKNIIDAMGYLRYGDLYEGSTIMYNRDPQLRKVSDLEADYREKKEAGLNDAILFECLTDIVNARYRNDPIKRHREMLLQHLIPFPTKTDEEVERLPVSEEDKRFRAYFNDYVRRFEREESKIEKFGALLDFPEQLTRILFFLKGYNMEMGQSIQQSIAIQNNQQQSNANRAADRQNENQNEQANNKTQAA